MDKNSNKGKELLKEFFSLLKKIKFTDSKTKDGNVLRTPDDAIIVGSKLMLVGSDNAETAPADGDYTLEDGTVISIKSGVVANITPPSTPPSADKPTDAVMAVTPCAPGAAAPAAKEKMDAPAATPEMETPAEQGNEDANMQAVLGVLKNIVDRVSALEEKVSGTAMAVQKMAAAPAAKPIVTDAVPSVFAEGTIGYELEKFNSERKAKKEKFSFGKSEKSVSKFNSQSMKRAEEFDKRNQKLTEKELNEKLSNHDFEMNFGRSMDSFEVTN